MVYCQLFHSKAAWGRRPGCYVTQEGCPLLLPKESGMLSRRSLLESLLEKPPTHSLLSVCRADVTMFFMLFPQVLFSFTCTLVLSLSTFVLLQMKLCKYGDKVSAKHYYRQNHVRTLCPLLLERT